MSKALNQMKSDITTLSSKADKSYVDQIKETTAAAVNTVTAALTNKADKDDTYLKTDTYSKVEMYTQTEVDDMLAKVYAAIEDGDKLRRQREAESKRNLAANDEGNGNGNDNSNNNGNNNNNAGVAVGATVPSVLLIGVLIAVFATRKTQGAGRQAGRTQQRGGKKAAARRGRQPARARQQQDSPQVAYGQAASKYNNPPFSNAGDATYEEIADVVQSNSKSGYGANYEYVEMIDANANTDAGYGMDDGALYTNDAYGNVARSI